jgi:hypothetical protein
MHQFLSDQQLTDLEDRYKSLKKIVMMDMETLITEVRAYKELTSVLQSELKVKSDESKPTADWDHLPTVLSPIDIQKILKISKNHAYSLLWDPPFHVRHVGQLIKIPKVTFLKWLLENEKS